MTREELETIWRTLGEAQKADISVKLGNMIEKCIVIVERELEQFDHSESGLEEAQHRDDWT